MEIPFQEAVPSERRVLPHHLFPVLTSTLRELTGNFQLSIICSNLHRLWRFSYCKLIQESKVLITYIIPITSLFHLTSFRVDSKLVVKGLNERTHCFFR